MSRSEVSSSENSNPIYQENDILSYDSSIDGKDVAVIYYFSNNKLYRARYILQENHSNKNDFISDFQDFKLLLGKKYGKAEIDGSSWKNELYKNNPEDWGLAISIGHLVYYALWKTTRLL